MYLFETIILYSSNEILAAAPALATAYHAAPAAYSTLAAQTTYVQPAQHTHTVQTVEKHVPVPYNVPQVRQNNHKIDNNSYHSNGNILIVFFFRFLSFDSHNHMKFLKKFQFQSKFQFQVSIYQ